ncbi:MAG: 30S ribosomal protein S5 [Acidobacteria bacterium]|nr:30S ribosomal protein S5 [Acidobacteriota bacterium]
MQRINPDGLDLKDNVISINRVTKVVKGGKNMSFSVLVVVGDNNGVVGFGSGKAKEVPIAIRKAVESAKKNLVRIPLEGHTLTHPMIGNYGAGKVMLKPAPEGTGVIAGAAVRSIMQALGVQNVVTKVIGSNNPHNIVRATFDGLGRMKSRDDIARIRGKRPEEL